MNVEISESVIAEYNRVIILEYWSWKQLNIRIHSKQLFKLPLCKYLHCLIHKCMAIQFQVKDLN